MPGLQTAGDLNVVIVGWADATTTVSSVTDTEGNTYAAALPPTVGTGVSQVIYYAKNIAGDSTTPNQITVTFSQVPLNPDIRILEYRGLDIAAPLDVAAVAGAPGFGSLADSGACTTTTPVELIVAGFTVGTHITDPGTGFTIVDLTQPNGDSAQHQITAAAGSCESTAPLSSDSGWVAQSVAFKLTPDFSLSATPWQPHGGGQQFGDLHDHGNPAERIQQRGGSHLQHCSGGDHAAHVLVQSHPGAQRLRHFHADRQHFGGDADRRLHGHRDRNGRLQDPQRGRDSERECRAEFHDCRVRGCARQRYRRWSGHIHNYGRRAERFQQRGGPDLQYRSGGGDRAHLLVQSNLGSQWCRHLNADDQHVGFDAGQHLHHYSDGNLRLSHAYGSGHFDRDRHAGFHHRGVRFLTRYSERGGIGNVHDYDRPAERFQQRCGFDLQHRSGGKPAACLLVEPDLGGGGFGNVHLDGQTTAPTTASLAPGTSSFYAMWLPIGGLALLGTGLTSRRRKLLGWVLLGLMLTGLIFMAACGGTSSGGGGGHPGTPAGTYTVTVTGTAGSLVHTAPVTVVVH